MQVKLIVTTQIEGSILYGSGNCVPVSLDLATSRFSDYVPCERLLADHAGLRGVIALDLKVSFFLKSMYLQ